MLWKQHLKILFGRKLGLIFFLSLLLSTGGLWAQAAGQTTDTTQVGELPPSLPRSVFGTATPQPVPGPGAVTSPLPAPSSPTHAPSMVTQAIALTTVALLPYMIILLTAFIKVVVVLSLLRNALGVQQSPPNQVINGLALILSIYIMYPTGVQMYDSAKDYIKAEEPSELLSGQSAVFIVGLVDRTKEPLRDFLERNTDAAHLKGFFDLAKRALPEQYRNELKPTDFLVIVPAYITTQLKDAYEIGVLIYLPFFVVDLVVSNILLAMGMMMLSPLTIALPLKLLLLVMLDGWTVLLHGLILTYQ